MILEELEVKNKKLTYWRTLLILLGLILISWIVTTLFAIKNKEFTDKKAQLASKKIGADFKIEVINSLLNKYGPTELELEKINPYTEIKPIQTKSKKSEVAEGRPLTESSSSAQDNANNL